MSEEKRKEKNVGSSYIAKRKADVFLAEHLFGWNQIRWSGEIPTGTRPSSPTMISSVVPAYTDKGGYWLLHIIKTIMKHPERLFEVSINVVHANLISVTIVEKHPAQGYDIGRWSASDNDSYDNIPLLVAKAFQNAIEDPIQEPTPSESPSPHLPAPSLLMISNQSPPKFG